MVVIPPIDTLEMHKCFGLTNAHWRGPGDLNRGAGRCIVIVIVVWMCVQVGTST